MPEAATSQTRAARQPVIVARDLPAGMVVMRRSRGTGWEAQGNEDQSAVGRGHGTGR